MKKVFKTIIVLIVFAFSTQIANGSTSLEIDFTINHEIGGIGSVQTRELDIEPLVVRNNSDLYDVEITKITASSMNGWELIDDNSDFDSIKPNSKKLSLTTADGKSLKDGVTDSVYISSMEMIEIELLGKICKTYPSKDKTQIAQIIVELRPVLDAETVLYQDGTFIINELTYNREENQKKHGPVEKTYVPLSEENPYVMPDSNTILWKAEAPYIKRVEIGSYIKPISTAYWFFNCYNLEYLDSNNLDMSECISTYMMFYCAGKNVTSTFKLVGLDEWNVSKVETFAGMFNQAGFGAKEWDVGDLCNWQTNSAQDLSNMFNNAGYNAEVWDIGNLNNWDVSNVKYFMDTFNYSGYYAKTWNIGDLSKWKTDSANNMSNMFANSGYNSTEWNIGDLGGWNVSNVIDFEGMFEYAGGFAKEIDLGKINWDLSNANNIKDMFYGFGCNSERVSIGAFTISNNNNITSAFRTSKNLVAKISVKDYVTNNNRSLQSSATGSNGDIQLIPLSDEALNWCNEMITLYGPSGSKSKGNIWI